MNKNPRIPIIILSGFLGSGKTTLLSKWIHTEEFRDAQVIVNELGEVGLDHHALSVSADAPVLLENGCACCTVFENLAETLERLFWDRLHRKIPRFSWVLVETTGIANPQHIARELKSRKILTERYDLHAVVTVVDAKNATQIQEVFGEFSAQLEAADLVVLSKIDQATPEAIDETRSLVRQYSDAPLLQSSMGNLSPGILLNYLENASTHQDKASGTQTDETSPAFGTFRKISEEHADAYTASFYPLDQAVDRETLLAALAELTATFAFHLPRIKGQVMFADEAGSWEIHLSPGTEISTHKMTDAESTPGDPGLTIISHGIDSHIVLTQLDKLLAQSLAKQ